jgi:hypothetical protein
MVNKNLTKTINDSLRLIRYDRSKILSEQSDATNVVANQDGERLLKSQSDPKRYPNYCSYPNKAILPPDPYGDGGFMDDPEEGVFCFYPTPSSQQGKTEGKFIPADAEIIFTDDLDWYDKMVSKMVDKYGLDESYAEKVITDIFPQGVVRSFTFNGQTYNAHIKRVGSGNWEWAGFLRKGDGEMYISPRKKDTRNEYQKFIDEWGLTLQLTAVIATAIAGLVSGGSSWVLTAEILLELGVGVAVGLRELEKGENVGAILSFVTGLLPMLKLSKAFKGISDTAFTSLSSKLKNSGLTKSSSFRDYLKFYRTLDPDEQKVLSQLLQQDEIARTQLWNQIKIALDSEIPKIVMKSIKENPKLLKDLKFWDKLWARELSTNLIVGIIGMSTELLFGRMLNDAEKQKIQWIVNEIPDEYKKEFAYNVSTNGEVGIEAIKKLDVSSLPKKGTPEAMSKWYNENVKEAINSAGGQYVELPDDPTKAQGNVIANLEIEKKHREDGWVPESELNSQEWFDYKKLSGRKWYKISP